MRTVDIIEKKRDGEELTAPEIQYLISGYCAKTIPDYQMSAFAMAVVWRGMTVDETANLTEAMIASGDTISLEGIHKPTIDKHSTGGVGDKTTLVVAPLVASLGYAVPKLSGRGLGHTGGTLDKLESIPGFRTKLPREEFLNIVNEVGCAVASPTENLVPADQLLYALRDATATVRSLPLIASSIMSKKLAVETDAISLDVKVGEGAFFRTLPEAEAFARLAIGLGKRMGRHVHCMLTSMEDPLGMSIGNAIEVIEAINTLHGHGPVDFTELCMVAATTMVQALDPTLDQHTIEERIGASFASGAAWSTFCAWIEAQGGECATLDDPTLLPRSKRAIIVVAPTTGVITHLHALALGHVAMELGAGRETKDDDIDYGAGIELHVQRGNAVQAGDALATLLTNVDTPEDVLQQRFLAAIEIDPTVASFPVPSPILSLVGEHALHA